MQFILNKSSLNKIRNKNKLLPTSISKFLHYAINGEEVYGNGPERKSELKINKANILEKLKLINPKLKNEEYDILIIKKAIELNFPIYPQYVKYLLNSLLKSNVHYIIDYKYCNGIILNTFFFYMIMSIIENDVKEKQSLQNLIIYVIFLRDSFIK